MTPAQVAALSLAGAAGLVRALTLDREVGARVFANHATSLGWGIHHDEKFLARDARALTGAGAATFADYRHYPPSAAFGVGGTALTALGFGLFGANNIGLRAAAWVCSTTADAFLLVALFHLLPLWSATVLGLAYVSNFNHFVATRHNVLEHVLMATVLGLFCIWVVWPSALQNWADLAGTACGLLIAFKWSFPVMSGVLLVGMLLVDGAPTGAFVRMVAGLVIGVAGAGLVNLGVLAHFGLLRAYVLNIRTVLASHRGRPSLAAQPYRPSGWRSLPTFVVEFARFQFGIDSLHGLASVRTAVFTCLTAGAVPLATSYPSLPGATRRAAACLAFYQCFHQVLFWRFFPYFKRIYTVLPFSFLLFALMCEDAGNLAAAWLPGGRGLVAVVAVLLLSAYLGAQAEEWASRHQWVDGAFLRDGTAALLREVPLQDVIYADGLAFRMLWRCDERRISAFDEQFKSSAEAIVSWAVSENARWVVLHHQPRHELPPEGLTIVEACAYLDVPDSVGDQPMRLQLYRVRPPYVRLDEPVIPTATDDVLRASLTPSDVLASAPRQGADHARP